MDTPPAEQLRTLAAEAQTNRTSYGMAVINADAWSTSLLEIADDIDVALNEAQVAPKRLCGARGHQRRQEPCDRPAAHDDEHTWEIGKLRQQLREYEERAHDAQTLRSSLAAARSELKRTKTALAALQKRRHWWSRKRKPPPDRG